MSNFDSSVGAQITKQEAIDECAALRNAHPNHIRSYSIGRDHVDAILAQADCVGIRMYHTIDPKGGKNLLLVGINSGGDDMVDGYIANRADVCPTLCPRPSELNQ